MQTYIHSTHRRIPLIQLTLTKDELNQIVRWGKTGSGGYDFYCQLDRLSNSPDLIPPKVIRKVSFVYQKSMALDTTWRTVEVITETSDYIEGIEHGDFKKFLKSKILGGKILPA